VQAGVHARVHGVFEEQTNVVAQSQLPQAVELVHRRCWMRLGRCVAQCSARAFPDAAKRKHGSLPRNSRLATSPPHEFGV
jgi:hypothetical protein